MARLLWTQKQNFGPAPRSYHALAFDTNRSRVVLFGGLTVLVGPTPTEIPLGDTWEWDGENWTQVDDIGPSPRSLFAMAFDRNRNKLVLFGGGTASAPSGETWEWDGQNWTEVSETGPQARIRHAMVFDSSKNIVTLYGGQLQTGNPTDKSDYFNDTWDWDGQNWTQQEDTGPNRCDHATAYDDSRQRLVLFGGYDAKNPQYGDTWEWDGTTWTQRSDFGPPACSGAKLVFTGAECVLFGGMHNNLLQNQTWTWNGTYWTARQDMGPAARIGHGLAFDSVRGQVVLFAGLILPDLTKPQVPVGDTWEQNADPAAQGPGGGQSVSLTLTSFQITGLTTSSLAPGDVLGQGSIQLSGPAPAGGAVVTLSCSDAASFQQGGQVTVPAGQSSLQIQFSFSLRLVGAMPSQTTIVATLQNGNAIQTTAPVS